MENSTFTTARQILTEVMNYRRTVSSHDECGGVKCHACSSAHLPRILSAVKDGHPIKFVLPAFPGKSPNPNKVLGVLPDHAERLSLIFIGELCQKIRSIYSPGIKFILCSDGRVFSDVVGIKESDISAYQIELKKLIQELGLSDISTFDLDEFYTEKDFTLMRADLMKHYGRSLQELKEKVSIEDETKNLYLGITRFLFEDSLIPGETKSRAQLQKDARLRAYEVIRRSNAWSELIAEKFPDAVRLSIHPHACGSQKLGIQLVGQESWMTPWHGVAIETVTGFRLLKRSAAEELGATLVFTECGRPSHFQFHGAL
jgi:pyoverdine/dityrosine biosynthesis protein Dit1